MEGKKPHSFLAEGISGVGVPSDAKGILQFLQDPSNQLDDLCEAILLREGQKKNGSIHHFDESSVAASPSLQTSTNPSQKGASVATITAFSNENQSGRYANSSQETVATTSSTITATLKPASRLSHQSNAWFNAGGNSWMTNRVDFTSHMRNNPQNLARRESLNTNDLNSTSMTYGSTSNSMKCGEHNVDDNTVLSEHFLCENFAEGHSNASDPLTSSFNSNYSPLSPPSAFYLQHAHRGQVWTHPSTTSPAFVTVVHPPNHIQAGLGPAFFVHPGVPIGSVVVPSSSASYLPIHQSQIYQQPVSMTGATTAALPDDTFITAAPTSAVDESTARFQRWTRGEDQLLIHATKQEGGPPHNWNRIAAKYFPTTRTGPQCKTRWKKALKPGLKLGQWKSEEDLLIVELYQQGCNWTQIAQQLTGRAPDSIRQRFLNCLDPSKKKTPWTVEENNILCEAQKRLGNKWLIISKLLPGRSENDVKNRWHNAKVSERRKLHRQAKKTARLMFVPISTEVHEANMNDEGLDPNYWQMNPGELDSPEKLPE